MSKKFDKTNEERYCLGSIRSWGYLRRGGNIIDHSRNIGQRDIAAMSHNDKKNIIFGEARSRFTIGFEVEKSASELRSGDLPFLAFLESDGSLSRTNSHIPACEGVSNIMPCVGPSLLRTKVRDAISECRYLLDLPTNRTCGGHVTVKVDGMSSEELLAAMRPFAGVIYSVWKNRLAEYYCANDIFFSGCARAAGRHGNSSGDPQTKYRVCKIRGNGMVEFRVPSAVRSVESLLVRYDLFYILLDCAANGYSNRTFRKRVKPVLMRMYASHATTEAKVDAVLRLAKSFQTMISTRTVNTNVRRWVDPQGDWLQPYYNSTALSELRRSRNTIRI